MCGCLGWVGLETGLAACFTRRAPGTRVCDIPARPERVGQELLPVIPVGRCGCVDQPRRTGWLTGIARACPACLPCRAACCSSASSSTCSLKASRSKVRLMGRTLASTSQATRRRTRIQTHHERTRCPAFVVRPLRLCRILSTHACRRILLPPSCTTQSGTLILASSYLGPPTRGR